MEITKQQIHDATVAALAAGEAALAEGQALRTALAAAYQRGEAAQGRADALLHLAAVTCDLTGDTEFRANQGRRSSLDHGLNQLRPYC